MYGENDADTLGLTDAVTVTLAATDADTVCVTDTDAERLADGDTLGDVDADAVTDAVEEGVVVGCNASGLKGVSATLRYKTAGSLKFSRMSCVM